MTEQPHPPDRIKPVYETPEPGKEIRLIEEDQAVLKQGDAEVEGKVTITQEWSPMRLYWDFTGTNFDAFALGEVKLASKSFAARGRLFSQGKHRVSGYIEGTVEIGSGHKLDRLTFHLPDYPEFISNHDFHEEIKEDTRTTSIRWNEIVLEAEGWRIRLQPYRDIHSLRQIGRETQKAVLSGVGEIRKGDGTQFKKEKVKPVLEALRIFFSFACAEWSPPLLVVGSNNVAERSCQYWGNYDVTPKSYLRGWLDEHHGQHLVEAFPGFMARWSHENWQEPLELAVTWLIEASRQSGGTEGAIAFGQIPLEMLAWLVFVDDRTIVESDEFDRLSAASKLQILLAHCNIPFEVPVGRSALTTIATEMQKKGGKATTGPQLVAKVRNTIIHPNEKNRRILSEWESSYSVKIGDVRWEAQQLFKWYITLVLLRLIGYSGKYANRLTPSKLGEVEFVPWAVPDEKEAT
ncbi:MAG: hypothetical protein NTY19_41755 [Planctomycetota bacterium]|nr:hypothetical protein [Planctomycetota bacterium]